MAKTAGRHCPGQRGGYRRGDTPAMNWVRKSPSRVTTTITGFRSALSEPWTSAHQGLVEVLEVRPGDGHRQQQDQAQRGRYSGCPAFAPQAGLGLPRRPAPPGRP
ncbi:hypothetical protein ACPA9J_34300 [Pseudomonas aeruginosa]